MPEETQTVSADEVTGGRISAAEARRRSRTDRQQARRARSQAGRPGQTGVADKPVDQFRQELERELTEAGVSEERASELTQRVEAGDIATEQRDGQQILTLRESAQRDLETDISGQQPPSDAGAAPQPRDPGAELLDPRDEAPGVTDPEAVTREAARYQVARDIDAETDADIGPEDVVVTEQQGRVEEAPAASGAEGVRYRTRPQTFAADLSPSAQAEVVAAEVAAELDVDPEDVEIQQGEPAMADTGNGDTGGIGVQLTGDARRQAIRDEVAQQYGVDESEVQVRPTDDSANTFEIEFESAEAEAEALRQQAATGEREFDPEDVRVEGGEVVVAGSQDDGPIMSGASAVADTIGDRISTPDIDIPGSDVVGDTTALAVTTRLGTLGPLSNLVSGIDKWTQTSTKIDFLADKSLQAGRGFDQAVRSRVTPTVGELADVGSAVTSTLPTTQVTAALAGAEPEYQQIEDFEADIITPGRETARAVRDIGAFGTSGLPTTQATADIAGTETAAAGVEDVGDITDAEIETDLETTGGTIAERTTAGAVGTTGRMVLESPAAVQSVAETGSGIGTAAGQDLAGGDILGAGQTIGVGVGVEGARAADRFIQSSARNPLETVGALAGTGGLLGAGTRAGRAAGVGTRYAIQPGVEALTFGARQTVGRTRLGSAALQRIPGDALGPEEIILGTVGRGARGLQRTGQQLVNPRFGPSPRQQAQIQALREMDYQARMREQGQEGVGSRQEEALDALYSDPSAYRGLEGEPFPARSESEGQPGAAATGGRAVDADIVSDLPLGERVTSGEWPGLGRARRPGPEEPIAFEQVADQLPGEMGQLLREERGQASLAGRQRQRERDDQEPIEPQPEVFEQFSREQRRREQRRSRDLQQDIDEVQTPFTERGGTPFEEVESRQRQRERQRTEPVDQRPVEFGWQRFRARGDLDEMVSADIEPMLATDTVELAATEPAILSILRDEATGRTGADVRTRIQPMTVLDETADVRSRADVLSRARQRARQRERQRQRQRQRSRRRRRQRQRQRGRFRFRERLRGRFRFRERLRNRQRRRFRDDDPSDLDELFDEGLLVGLGQRYEFEFESPLDIGDVDGTGDTSAAADIDVIPGVEPIDTGSPPTLFEGLDGDGAVPPEVGQ